MTEEKGIDTIISDAPELSSPKAPDSNDEPTLVPDGKDGIDLLPDTSVSRPEIDLQVDVPKGNDDNGFVGADEEEGGGKPPEDKKSVPEKLSSKNPQTVNSEKISDKNNESGEITDSKHNKNTPGETTEAPNETAENSKVKKITPKLLSNRLIIGLIVVVLLISGAVIYAKISFIGFKKASNPSNPETSEAVQPVQTIQKQNQTAKSPDKNIKYPAQFEETDRLRDELLEKSEEIYRLKLHYLNGIAELEEEIEQEIQKVGIASSAQALKNRRIELNLRTIQRREAYIRELEKPVRWINQGREELLYLKRRAQLDLQLFDIAGGVDIENQMRTIEVAIQKYRPCAKKFAVVYNDADLPILETIWGRIVNRKKKIGQSPSDSINKEIAKEICSGNLVHIAELTNISAATVRCLSKMNGSDLFLNGLTTLSPSAAEKLLQWQGNWICLNGVKELSPAAAQYLFKWGGSWISLNGLAKFPPELAMYLMKWEGKQLELMGLEYHKNNADPKALKYLALWETTGGKLFVSDDVRREIEQVMM